MIAAEQGALAPRPRTDLVDLSSGLSEALRYGAGMAVVAVLFGTLGLLFGSGAQTEPASEVDRAVLIDLPAADSSSDPARQAEEGPEQAAAAAETAVRAPDEARPERALETPKATMTEAEGATSLARPDPAAVKERRQDGAPAPTTRPSPPTPAEDARAPTGADAPLKLVGSGDNDATHPSARVITLWQRSLMRRLEMAKRSLRRKAQGEGVAKVAFEIDGRGAIRAEWLAASSGSARLDEAALALVAQAAPFPAPPAGVIARDLSFIVPVRFKR